MTLKTLKSYVERFYFTHAFPKYKNSGFKYDSLLKDEKESLQENLNKLKERFVNNNGEVIINNKEIKKIGYISSDIWAYFYNYSFLGWGWPPSPKRVGFVEKTVKSGLKRKSLLDILDVGCGEQPVTYTLDNKNFYKVGADISETALERALKNGYLQEAWFLDFNKVKEEELPKRSFDYIIMSEVLEHTGDPKSVIKKFSSLLKEEGSLVITIPNPKCVAFLIDFVFHGFKFGKYYKLNRSHNPTVNNKSLMQIINEINKEVKDNFSGVKTQDDKNYYKLSLMNQENRPAKLYGFFPKDKTLLDTMLIKLSKQMPEIFSFQFFYEIKKEKII